MAAAMMEGALDLSAKSPDTRLIKPCHSPIASHRVTMTSSHHMTPPASRHSPVPSLTSDTDSQVADRASSVSSDGHETDTSTSTAVKPILDHSETKGIPSAFTGGLPPALTMIPPETPDHTQQPGGVRPFNMYTTQASPHLPGGVPAMMPPGITGLPGLPGVGNLLPPSAMPAGYNPAALQGLQGLMTDPAIGLTCSPIAQYLQQRKRRAERQAARSPQDTEDDHLMSQPESEDLKRIKMSPGHTDTMTPPGGEKRDESYWERRRKNNEAAKRSRDSRRMKEEEIALRAAFLEQENLKLRAQVAILKNETAKLHYMLYNRM